MLLPSLWVSPYITDKLIIKIYWEYESIAMCSNCANVLELAQLYYNA